MPMVFLSYATKDHFFAELAVIKLGEAGISLWRDKGQLRAGSEWRGSIERGIAESVAVLVALSESSAASPYVTFEWAYGLGKGKTVVPLKLESCKVHERLEPIQHLDFSMPGVLPWNLLIERINEIVSDATAQDDIAVTAPAAQAAPIDPNVNKILGYLNQRGYQMVSYERLRSRVSESLTDVQLDSIVNDNPTIFRPATMKEGKKGLAKRVP
jgi:hypothetical protein